MNYKPIIPIDHLEMKSSIWGVRSSLRSDQNENIPNLNPIIQIDHFEMRSVIWGDRSRIGSDQYVNSI